VQTTFVKQATGRFRSGPQQVGPIRAEDYLPDIAIDPTNGAIYVVWSDGSRNHNRPRTHSRRVLRMATGVDQVLPASVVRENVG
jgi:hypothetical protein